MPFVCSVGKDFDHLARLMHKTRKSVIDHYYMVKLRACNETGLKPEPYCRGTRRLRPRNASRSVKVTCMLRVCGHDTCISCQRLSRALYRCCRTFTLGRAAGALIRTTRAKNAKCAVTSGVSRIVTCQWHCRSGTQLFRIWMNRGEHGQSI